MRGKTARRLRKFIKVVHRSASLTTMYEKPEPRTVYNTPIPLPISKTAAFLGQLKMKWCHRKAYQEAKKAWKMSPHIARELPWSIK